MTGRVTIVTGANTGLGYEVSRYLAEGGNEVILACRSEERANRAIEKIKRLHPNALVSFMQLDLADAASIRQFVETFSASGKKLHVLVNNAGVMPSFKDSKRQFTKENFELTVGTNYLGHFLLTNLLLDELKKTGGEENGDARIINITSSIHDPDSVKRKTRQLRELKPLDFENFFLFTAGSYNGLQAYKNSKTAAVMFTYELARRLDGTHVTANCVDPGFMPTTELMRSAGGVQKFVNRYILHGLLRFTKTTRTVQQGATAVCALITDDKYKGVTGKYFKETTESKSSTESLDEEAQKKLWQLSGGYVKMEGYEAIEVTQPPPEEEPKKEEKKKKEKKEDKAAAPATEGGEGEAKPAEEVKAEGEEEKAKTEEAENEKTEEKIENEEIKVETKKDEKIVKEEEIDDIEKQKAENKALEEATKTAPAILAE